jgi:hypothetical protein
MSAIAAPKTAKKAAVSCMLRFPFRKVRISAQSRCRFEDTPIPLNSVSVKGFIVGVKGSVAAGARRRWRRRAGASLTEIIASKCAVNTHR